MPVNDLKALQRQATLDYLQDKERVDELLEALAEGESLKALCSSYELTYPTTLRYLIKHYHADYEAAKEARAEAALEEMSEVEGRLEGRPGTKAIDAFGAKETLASKRWRAERLNPKRYAPKQTIDMNHTDMTALHLDAIRKLSRTSVVPAGPAIAAPVSPNTAIGQDVLTGHQGHIDVPFTEVSSTTVVQKPES